MLRKVIGMDKILIIEDEANIRQLVSYHLAKSGYEIYEAEDGVRGLELALTENPGLLLLDLMLPEMNGMEICRRLREQGSNIPIIILTAKNRDGDKVNGLELGAEIGRAHV